MSVGIIDILKIINIDHRKRKTLPVLLVPSLVIL